jgi:hypothetical protein
MRGEGREKGLARIRRTRRLQEWLRFEELGADQRDERVTNLHQVAFDAAKQEVRIEYYLVDDNHPPLVLSFAEFAQHLQRLF